jgi:hypothetical protein
MAADGHADGWLVICGYGRSSMWARLVSNQRPRS